MPPNAAHPPTGPCDRPRRRGAHAAALARGAAVPVLIAAVVTAAAPGWTGYTLRKGDTLYDLAARHGTTVGALVAANGLPVGGRLVYAGRTINVPAGTAVPTGDTGTTGTGEGEAPPTTSSYTVRPGDTLYDLAARHGTSVAALVAANGLRPDGRLVVAGRIITIPGTTGTSPGTTASPATPSPTTAGPAATSYRVRSGDTLGGIAARFGTTVAALVAANNLPASGRIVIAGSTIAVAGTEAQPVADDSNTFAGRTYPAEVVAAANLNRTELARRGVPSREHMRDLISSTARANGVDPRLALAISWQESGWNQSRVSVANAVGAMQVIPSTGEWVSSEIGRDLDLLDPEDNATAGVSLLAILSRQASLDEVIAGYYQGLSSVRRNGMYSDTVAYVANIKALMQRY